MSNPSNAVRKKVDPRIRTLIENGVKQKFRSMFVIVGDRGKDQVVNLHYMLSKATVKTRPSVLWCYKKELGFSSHRKKRMRQVKKKMQRGLYDPDKDDPFELFVSATSIRYTYYSESHKILGNTYGMCVLQDFEALTPNLLARTIETVEGGGIIVLLLKTMKSLRQLYTMTMDVHARLRTESRHDVTGRFNERFLLSLGSCKHCLVVDDELEILPISSHSRSIKPIGNLSVGGQDVTPEEIDLKELKNSLRDTEVVGQLVNTARTLDQAKVILTCIEAISEKSLRSTVAITASRGRGKSAALGIAMAAAVASGYSNIFVTSPSPENLKTLFEFVLKGFDCLGYEEHLDYELLQSSNPEFNKAIVRVNIFRTHRQTIQYIHPQDYNKLGQAELVVIDEAAAIPLPYVQKLLGPYLVFMASTINGYEGTGRSLSLKLIDQLRKQSGATSVTDAAVPNSSGRLLKELQMQVPIRYGFGDPIEKWLNDLLCLDASTVRKITSGCPHPSQCNLYQVNSSPRGMDLMHFRDTLFSYHKASESFLQRMMSLYVSSHYKNSPNDLLLMSDAPAHSLYVLLGPVDETQNSMPEILCVVQVCLEGELNKQTVKLNLSRGKQAAGDLIPWTMSQQFQDDDFASLSGARIVRIATHPDYQRMGYGRRALDMLTAFYQGDLANLEEADKFVTENDGMVDGSVATDGGDLMTEEIKPRRNLPPLLTKLEECKPQRLQWLGTSYGITLQLFNFWSRAGFVPTYVRQTSNELTGEHSCIMMKSLRASEDSMEFAMNPQWLHAFHEDFKRRFVSLLSYEFASMPPALALSVLAYKPNVVLGDPTTADGSFAQLTDVKPEFDLQFSRFDIKRLGSYASNLVDYHVILDLLPTVAKYYFLGKFRTLTKEADDAAAAAENGDNGEDEMTTRTVATVTNNGISLSYAQAAILLCLGLQHKTVDKVVEELTLQPNQILALFTKIIKKVVKYMNTLQDWEIDSTLPKDDVRGKYQPLAISLDDELDARADDGMASLRDKQNDILKSLGDQYAIKGTDEDWEKELKGPRGKKLVGKVSIGRKGAGGGSSAKGAAPLGAGASASDSTFTRELGADKRGKKRKSVGRG